MIKQAKKRELTKKASDLQTAITKVHFVFRFLCDIRCDELIAISKIALRWRGPKFWGLVVPAFSRKLPLKFVNKQQFTKLNINIKGYNTPLTEVPTEQVLFGYPF